MIKLLLVPVNIGALEQFVFFVNFSRRCSNSKMSPRCIRPRVSEILRFGNFLKHKTNVIKLLLVVRVLY